MADFAPIDNDFLDYLVEKATPTEILAFEPSSRAQARAESLLERSSEGMLTPMNATNLNTCCKWIGSSPP